MKVQVIYSSLTGCTERLAKAIFDAIPNGDKTIHNLADGAPALTGDVILCGYWGVSGGPSEDVEAFLKTIKGRAVGVFCTLGYYADSAHAFDTVQKGVALLKENNEIIGSYVCNGAVAASLKEGQGKIVGAVPTEQKELRWEMIAPHPTKAECDLGAERFCERLHLYERAKELHIPYTSIL